ncbi:MAG: MBL fold metallo-hydrolase [Marinicellaceae bacterium]
MMNPSLSIAMLVSFIFLSSCHKKPSPAESMSDFCQKLPRAEYQNLQHIENSSSWFELYSVAPGVTAIYEPHQWQEAISYLIEGDKEALLFDTGNGIADILQIVQSLTKKPVSVLNSHSHYDHVGGNYAFKNIYGLKTDFTINRQKGHKNEKIKIEVSKQALCKPLPKGVTEANHIGKSYKINRFIKNNHIIDLGNRQLKVIHTPGHTPDALILIDADNGLMFTGDTYYSGPIWLYAPETDLEQYQKSLQTMIENSNNIRFLLPAHNTPIADPQLLKQALLGIQSVIKGDIAPISAGEGMVEYIINETEPFTFLMRNEKLPYKTDAK